MRDITERKQAEIALRELTTSLEQQIQQRTADLLQREVETPNTATNLHATILELEVEIAERQRAEAALQQMQEGLAQRLADQTGKLGALYEVILMGSQTLATHELLEQALARILAAAGADAACIHDLDASDQTLRLAAQQGLPAVATPQVHTLPVGWLLDNVVPRNVPDLGATPGVPPELRLPGYVSYLGAPINVRGQARGALSIFWTCARQVSVEDIALCTAMADQLGLLEENIRLRLRSEEAAVLRERQRLARELHDSVTQSLHSVVLLADVAADRLRRGALDRLETNLAQLQGSARQALKEMRLLLYELRPVSLSETDLLGALELRLETVERRAGVDVQLLVDRPALWPSAWEPELYAIAMEALNNSLKHAHANQLEVCLQGGPSWAELTVSDNGQGFDTEGWRRGGLGLQDMAERAERLDGRLSVLTAAGQGTRVSVRIERPVPVKEGL